MNERNGLSIASLVLGLIGIVAWLLPLAGYPVTIVAIVLGVKGMKQQSGRGMAIAGLVLGIVFLVLTLINSVLGAYLGAMEKLY